MIVLEFLKTKKRGEDGSFLLTPIVIHVDHLVDRVAKAMAAGGATKVDYPVTINRKHFIDDPEVAVQASLRMGTPGEASHFASCLMWES